MVANTQQLSLQQYQEVSGVLGIDEATYKGDLSLHLFHFTVELNFLINYRIFEGNEKQILSQVRF